METIPGDMTDSSLKEDYRFSFHAVVEAKLLPVKEQERIPSVLL